MPIIYVFILFCLFGSMFSLTKVALNYSPPIFLLAVRMLIAGVVLLAHEKIFHKKNFFPSLKELKWSFPLGLISFFLCNIFEYWGLQFVSASKTCFIYGLTPFITAILCYFLYKEKITPMKFLGMLIGLSAFIPTFINSETSEQGLSHLYVFSLAELAIVAATTFAVIGWLMTKAFLQKTKGRLLSLNGQAMLISGIMGFIASPLLEDWPNQQFPVTQWNPFFMWTIVIVIVSNIICYNLYGLLLKHYTATFMSFAGFMTPLFAAIWGYLLLGENIDLTFFFSVLAVGLGLYLYYKDELMTISQVPRQQGLHKAEA